MGYLYEEVMNVPGLNGSAGDRQAQLYQRLGAPFGAYNGSYDQNIWLLNQIRSGNVGVPQTPPTVAPQEPMQQPQVAVPVPNKITPFEEVLPYQSVFNPNLISSLAESQINPEIARQKAGGIQSYRSGLGASGGYRSGRGIQGFSDLNNQYERQRQEQLGSFTGQIQDYATDFYNKAKTNYYTNPSAFVMPTLPDYNSFIQQNPDLFNAYQNQTNTNPTYTSPLNY